MARFNLLRLFHFGLVLVFSATLVGCATLEQTATQAENASEASAESTNQVAEADPPVERDLPVRPKIELSEDIMFKVLLAEVAGQRGKLDIAVENYLDLARTTRDPVVIERATRIAVYARDDEAAMQAAALWAEMDPLNSEAHQVLTVMTLRQGKLDESLKHLEIILANSQGKFDQKLWMIANFLGQEENQAAVMQLMESLMANHMDNAEAIYAFAHVTAQMGDTERSQKLLERVLELKPDNEPATMTYISLLQKKGDINAALTWIENSLEKNPDNYNLRMAYARLLTDSKRLEDARKQFELLAEKEPEDTDVIYALGLLYLQVNKLEEAKVQFAKLGNLNKRIYDANYYLARIAEEENNLDKASDLYQGVQGGENHFDAQIRLSLILAKQGSVNKALTNIRAVERPKDSNRLILIQAEGEILTEAKRYQEAMSVFDKAIEEKSHPDLYYSRAMLAEKMERLDVLEADLKTILEEDPNNATALNALGYTLADKTERYEEAYTYIKRAHELNPENFYILDSMGWILYRLGRLDEAVDFLQKALMLRNDPEIAAHLGEVLWVMGNRKAASEIWETALKDTPADDRLLKVIERFKQ